MEILQRQGAYKFIIVSAISIICLCLCLRKAKNVWTAQLVQVRVCGPLDTAVRAVIARTASNNFFKHAQARDFYAYLKTCFPIVRTVDYRYNGSLTIDITITTALPLVRIISSKSSDIADTYVCTNDRHIVPDWYFNTQVMRNVQHVTLDTTHIEKELQKPVLLDTICALNTDLFEYYDIVWRSEFEIVLKPKKYNKLEIITDSKTIFLKDKITQVGDIYQKNKKYHKIGMKADIRFEGILVCAALRGGGT